MANSRFFGNPLDRVTDEIRTTGYELPDFAEVAAPSALSAPSGNLLPPAEFEPLFVDAARQHQVPVNILMAMGQQESSYRPDAVGVETQWGRARGMMQYLDSTAQGLGIDPLDPAQAIGGAAQQFQQRLAQGYSVEEAIMAHHGGDDRRQWGPKTRQYAREVMQKAGMIGEQWQPQQAQQEEPGRYRELTPEELAAWEAQQRGEEIPDEDQAIIDRTREGLPPANDEEAREALTELQGQAQDPEAIDGMTGAAPSTSGGATDTPLDLAMRLYRGARDFLQTPASEVPALAARPGAERWEEREQARHIDAFTGAAPISGESDRTWEGWVKNLAGQAASGAGSAVGSSVEGLGLIAQQVQNVEAGRQLDEAASALDGSRQRLAEALESAGDRSPREALEAAQPYAEDLAQREIDFHREMVEWANREPGKAAEWLRGLGVDVQELSQELAADPEYQGIATDIAGGVGSMLTYMGPGFLSTLMTRGASAATRAAAGIAGASALAGPAGAAEAYQRAIDHGLDEEEAVEIAMYGIPAGVVQVAPVAVLLKRIPAGMRGRAMAQFRHLLESFGAEFVAEGGGAVLQNLIEKSYNEERGVWDDSLYQAAIGGSSSALIALGVQLATRGRGIGPVDRGAEAGREMERGLRRHEWLETPEMEALRRLDPQGYADAVAERAEQVAPGSVIAGDVGQPQGPAPEGPIERAAVETQAEEALAQVPGERVSVETRTGTLRGTVEDYYEDGQGGFQIQILSDEGEQYVFDQGSGVAILRDSVLGEPADGRDPGEDGPGDLPPMADVATDEAPDDGYRERVAQRLAVLEEAQSPQDVEDLIAAEQEDVGGEGREAFLAAADARRQSLTREARQRRQQEQEAARQPAETGETTEDGEPIIEHLTKRGRTLRGVVRDIDKREATALDRYTFRKNDGWFIRLDRLGEAEAPAAEPGAELVMKRDNTPFTSYERAQRAMQNRRIDGTPVQVEGGWAIKPTAQPSAKSADNTGLAGMGSGMAGAISENFRERIWQEYQGRATLIDNLPSRARQEAPGLNREQFIEWAERETAKRGSGTAWAREQGLIEIEAAPQAEIRGERIDDEWSAFAEDSGTRGVPRAEMPQIKAEHRGALANFLSARGIDSAEETVPASSLKPTQREFSEQRVEAAKQREGGDRAILVSSDGHVVDGHHQWLARLDQSEDVRVIRLNAPIDQVLEAAHEFPSSETDGEVAPVEGGQARSDQESRLPVGLRSAKPRYSYRDKQFSLDFESDVDKAAYITAQAKKSRRDADFLAFAMDAAGMSEGQVRRHGRNVREAIKALARDAEPGTLRVTPVDRGEALSRDFTVMNVDSISSPEAEARRQQAKREERQRTPPVADARREDRKRELRAQGREAAVAGEANAVPEWAVGDTELENAWTRGWNEGMAQRAQAGDEASRDGEVETLAEPLTLYHGTAAGNDFDAYDAARANSGVGSNARNQGNRLYTTPSERAARWFGNQAEQGRLLLEATGPLGDLSEATGDVLTFELAAGSRVLTVDNMPTGRGGAEEARQIVERAEAAGMDAVRFPEPGFDTVEGDPEVAAMLNEDGHPTTVMILNDAAITRARPQASDNTIFTEDMYQKARERLMRKAGQLNSGVDPEMMLDGITLAGYHVERGARSFASFAKAVVADVGDWAKPFLKSWYMGVKYDPRSAGLEGMDSAAAVDAVSVDEILAERLESLRESRPEGQGQVADYADQQIERAEAQREEGKARERLAQPEAELPQMTGRAWRLSSVVDGGAYDRNQIIQLAEQVKTRSGPLDADDIKTAAGLARGENPLGPTADLDAPFLSLGLPLPARRQPSAPAPLENTDVAPPAPAEPAPEPLARPTSEELRPEGQQPRWRTQKAAERYRDQRDLLGVYEVEAEGKGWILRRRPAPTLELSTRHRYSRDVGASIAETVLHRPEGMPAALFRGVVVAKARVKPSAFLQGDAMVKVSEAQAQRVIDHLEAAVVDHRDPDSQQQYPIREAGHDPERDPTADTQPLVDTAPESHDAADPGAEPAAIDGVRPARESGDGQPDPDRSRRGDGLERGQVAGADGAADAGGTGGSRPDARGPLTRREDQPNRLAGDNPGNFHIPEGFGLGQGGDGKKIADNLAAIRAMRQALQEGRFATRDEQRVLARYVGWGGLAQVFDPKHRSKSNQYGKAYAELQSLLTPEELAAANRSIQDAHYTSDKVVGMMWQAARHFGFTGGRALEPTVGTGNFLGLQPADLAGATEWHAAELDSVSGNIARLLYPEANVLPATGFQDAAFADGVFELAIGNPPFGRQGIRDRSKRRRHLDGMKIHNYIIAKAGMHLRPGGVMQMVVTHRFLDTANPEARSELAKHFRFLGAVRLPNNAFAENAGTEVTTDMVFLQKLRDGEQGDPSASWLDTQGRIEADGQAVTLNRYFQEHPEHILGKPSMGGTMYRGQGQEFTVEADGRDIGRSFTALLQGGAFAELSGVMEATAIERDTGAVMLAQSDLPVGGMSLTEDGRILQRDLDDDAGNAVIHEITPESYWREKAAQWGDAIEAVEAIKAAREEGRPVSPQELADFEEAAQVAANASGGRKLNPTKAEQALYDLADALVNPSFAWAFDEGLAAMRRTLERRQLGAKGHDALRALLGLRNRTLALIAAERSDAKNIEALRRELNQAYDAFRRQHGLISEPKNLGLLAGDVGVEVGLETGYQPEIKPAEAKAMGVKPQKASASKADILQRRVTWPARVIDHADNALDGMNISLSEKGRLDLGYVAELTGQSTDEVIRELAAQESIFHDPEVGDYVIADEYLSGNVKHKLEVARENGLEANAKALEAVQPEPKTQQQITPSIRGAWLPSSLFEEFLGALGMRSPNVLVQPSIGRISARDSAGELSDLGLQFDDPDAGVIQLFNAAASGKSLKIMRRDSDGNAYEDKEASKRVTAKAERMAEVFADWVYSDADRARLVVDTYNRTMNTHRERAWNGEKFLRPVGQSPSVTLRRTQKNAAWRMVQSQNVLTDHVVGAGKAQPLDAKILTPSGWVRMGDIHPGDKVIARNGKPTEVEAVFPQGEKEIFRVTFSDGSSTECCEEHLWLTQTYRERGYAQRAAKEGRDWPCSQGKVRSLAEIRETLEAPHLGAKNHSIPMVEAVEFEARDVPVDPYLLGALLGDGHIGMKAVSLSGEDAEIIERCRLPDGVRVRHQAPDDRCQSWHFIGERQGVNPMLIAMREMGLAGKLAHEKQIPEVYRVNSVEVRLEVLRGLMDTDGTVSKNGQSAYFTTVSPALADDATFLVQSLGGKVSRTTKVPSYRHNGEIRQGRESIQLAVSMPAGINPFAISRKAGALKPKTSYPPVRYIVDVESVGMKEAQCIRVADDEHLYVTDDFIVTHNTFTLITGIMERKRLGLSRKPAIAVPNHLVVQWASEFYQLYPGARILAATPDDFAKKNRRRMFARIATGDYDAIIIGHSSFGFIEPPAADTRAVIDENKRQLQEAMEQAKASGESSRTLKQMQKKLDGYDDRLKELAERERDRMGVDFEAMGIDYLAVDEAHLFKNLEYATAGERVVGMNDPKGSQRAFDLYTKVRGLQRRGGGVTFATGTPVSNSLVELYTMMRYLAHDSLVERQQQHFDAWSGAYAVTETRMEYTATQKLKPRRVLSGLANLDGLGQLYREFADIITMDDLKRIYAEERREANQRNGTNERTEFPVPRVKGGGRQLDTGKITASQSEYMDYLVARMQAIEENKRDPEYASKDNPLWVLTDARKMSLDIRIVDPTAERDEDGKVMRAARRIKDLYDRWDADKGTQMVFSDLSTPAKTSGREARKVIGDGLKVVFGEKEAKAYQRRIKGQSFRDQWREVQIAAERALDDPAISTDKQERIEAYLTDHALADGVMTVADIGFSVYDDLRQVLSEMGIPEHEIAFIHDYNTPEQKSRLFSRVNAGAIRVLIGSTEKMGAGTNAQKRLVGLHHLDAPWRPSDVEQREGRIIRQGNVLYERDPDGFEVEINAYSTNGTADTVMWQVLERKAAAIEQFRQAGLDSMQEDGADSDQYAEFMATSTGNPVFKLKLEAERDLTNVQAEVGGQMIAVQNARSFMERYAERREAATAKAEALRAMQVGELSHGGESGSPADLQAALEAAEEQYLADYAAWQKARDEAELAREKARNEGKKRLPAIPRPPARPDASSESVRQASGYARAVHALLADIGSGSKGDRLTIEAMVGSVPVRLNRYQSAFDNAPFYQVELVLPGDRTAILARSDAADPTQAPSLARALSPQAIERAIENELALADNRLEQLSERRDREAALASREVDDTPITEAKALRDWFVDQVKIAEYEADVKRAERDNRYIKADRTRDIRQFSAKGEFEAKRVEVGGETYQTTGLAARQGQTVIHDAVRDSDGRRAMVYETTRGEEVGREVMLEPSQAREQLRRATAQSNARQRIRQSAMSVAEATQRLRQGRYAESVSRLLESGKIRVSERVPAGIPANTAAYVDEQGVTHLIARNLRPEYLEPTLLHEAFHAGTRPLIGSRRWNELQERLAKLYRQAERSQGYNRQFWEAARARVAYAEAAGDVMDEARRIEEFGAYALEEYASAPRTLRNWASDMAGLVKAWLQRVFGIQAGEITPAQLRALAAAALRNGDMAPSPSLDAVLAPAGPLVDTEGRPVAEQERRAELAKALRQSRKALSVVREDGVRDRDGGITRDILKITSLIQQPYTIASMEPQFTPVFDTAMRQMRFRDTIISEMYPRFRTYKELRAESRAQVNKALELGRLSGLSFSDARLKQGVENKGYKTVITYDAAGIPQRRREPLHTALTKRGDVIKLNAEERAAYAELRALFDEALDLFRDQTLIDLGMSEFVGSNDPVGDILAAITDDMSDAAKERYQNIAKMAEEIEQAKRTGYVPLSRHGRFVITVKEKLADVSYAKNPQGGYIARGVPDSLDDFMREIGARWNDLEGGWQVSDGQRKQLNRETSRTVYSEKLDAERYADRWETWRGSKNGKRPKDLDFIKQRMAEVQAEWGGPGRRVSVIDTKRARLDGTLRLSDVDSLADLAQVDNETWQRIRDEFVKAMRGRGFRKHFFRAENVPGYSLDFERAIADYMASMAGYLSRRHHEQQWESAISGVKGPNLNAYAKEYRQYVNEPAEEYAVLRQTGFLFYIAGNVSTALLNSTQVPIMTMPALGQFMSHTRAAKEVTLAYKDALAMTSLYDQAREGWKRGGIRGAGDMMLQMFDPNDAPADVRAEVKAAWDDGMFAPQFTHEVMGFSNRRDGSPQAKLEKTIDYVASSYTYIERLNRLVTFIAAVRAAKDPKVQAKVHDGLKGNALARMTLLGDNWSPKAFGEHIVDESQFMMGKVNRAKMLRSHGAAVFQFMSFVINSLQAWYRWSTINGAGGKRAAAYSIAAIVALSGVWGAPGIDYLRKALEGLWLAITGEDEDLRYNLREWVGRQTGYDWLGEVVDKGGLYPLGMDMSGRLGFMRMLPDLQSPITALGIPADLLVGRPMRAGQQAFQGNYAGAVSELAPNFLRNPITARQWTRQGVVSRTGNLALTPEQIPTHALWYKALGIQPSIVSDAYEYRYATSRMARSGDLRTRRMVNRLARAEADATRNEEPARQAELERRIDRLWEEVEEYNLANPEAPMDPQSINRRVMSKAAEYLYGLEESAGSERRSVRSAAERAREVFNMDEVLERGIGE